MKPPMLKVLFCLVMVLTLCYAVENGMNVYDIFRGERDTFTNMAGNCSGTKAVCFDESCAYCQCKEDQTFVPTRGQHGKCVSNELLVYATSYEASFLVQNNFVSFNQYCIFQKPYGEHIFVRGSLECSEQNGNFRWILTNFGQLLNWETLECLTDDYHVVGKNQHFATMKKCDRNDRKQLWDCVGDKKYNIKQSQSSRYLYHGEHDRYVTTKNTKYPPIWTRFGSSKDVCSEAVGCETFTDGSSLAVLNKQKCEEQSECFGGKQISLNRTKCFLLPNRTQYLHHDTWEAMQMKNGSFVIISSDNKVFLKWNLNKTPKNWKGLLVKVQFQCESSTATTEEITTEHCVVIKYTGNFTVILPNQDDNYGDDHNNNGGNNEDKNDQQSIDSNKEITKIIVIVVCTSVLLCFVGVMIGTIVYKRRVSSARSKRRNRENPATNQDSSPAVQELAELANPSNSDYQPAPSQLQHYAIPTREHDYQNGYLNDWTFGVRPQSPKYELPLGHKYEYPERPQSHQYEYPSLGNEKADTTGKTDVRVEDGGYSPLVRPPLNKNESENSGYTSLINGQETSDKDVGAIGTKVNTDGMQNVDVVDGDYTPLVRPPLKDHENEPPRYTPLLINAGATGSNDEADELSYADVIDGDYTPLVRPPLKDHETEAPRYQPLIKGQKTSEEVGATGKKDKADGLSYVDVIDDKYTPLVRPPLKDHESEAPRYQPLIKCQKPSEEVGATGKKDNADGLLYVDVIDDKYTPLVRPPLKDHETEAPRYQPLMKGQKTSEEVGATGRKEEADGLSYVDVINGKYTPHLS